MKNITIKHSITGILFALFDCKYLLDSKPNFNWNIIKGNAIKTKTETQIYMAIKFINMIVPTLIPDKISKDNLFEKEFEDYCTLLIYNRFFILKLREQSRSLMLKDAIKHKKTIIEYLKFRPKYFLYKRKFLRTNPKLARKILAKQSEME